MANSASRWTSCSDSDVVDWSWSELIVLPEAAGELGMNEKSPLSEWSGEEGMNPKLWFGELKHDESPESIWPIWSKLMFWNRLFIVCWWGFTELSIFCVCLFLSLCFFVKVFQFSEKRRLCWWVRKCFWVRWRNCWAVSEKGDRFREIQCSPRSRDVPWERFWWSTPPPWVDRANGAQQRHKKRTKWTTITQLWWSL